MSPQYSTTSSFFSATDHHHVNSSRPPSLIQEEEEEAPSFFSANTDMYDTIIQVSPVPPTLHSPCRRRLQRMMMNRYEDTLLTASNYQTTHIVMDNRITSTLKVQKKKHARVLRDQLVKPTTMPHDLIAFFKKFTIQQQVHIYFL